MREAPMAAVLPSEERHFTYADYRAWELAPGERYELIDGAAYEMAAPDAYHQSILMELSRQIANFLYKKPCKIYPAPFDVRLFYQEDESDDTVVQPDISVICDKEKLGTEGCRGAPDLTVEILSPSNTAIEMSRKFNLYRRAGVREYWVIDPSAKSLHIHSLQETPLITRIYGASDTALTGVLPGLEIILEPIFAG
jgi:Uma2 family endonuclease